MTQIPILMYHWFREAGSPTRSRSPQLEIAPELFERQVAALNRGGYRSVSLESALGGNPPAGRNVVITFDDGTLDFWESARPALEKHGFTATLFVVSGHIGGMSTWDADLGEPARRLMSWEQIRKLQESGHEIGSHTHNHRPLIQLDDLQALDELTRSRELLAERLGTAPGYLAYPRGLYAERHKKLVRQAGYAGACSVILQWRDLFDANRYELRRMTIKGTESMLHFRLRLLLCRLVRYTGNGS